MASLVGESRHTLTLAGAQRYLVTPELHREQLAKCFARTESGALASARHLCSAALLAAEMQADAEVSFQHSRILISYQEILICYQES